MGFVENIPRKDCYVFGKRLISNKDSSTRDNKGLHGNRLHHAALVVVPLPSYEENGTLLLLNNLTTGSSLDDIATFLPDART